MIFNDCLEHNLIEHFKKWGLCIKKHGLFILEAHNVDPVTTSQHLGENTATAFDTYHGYSNQYPVDFDVFMKCISAAGLESYKKYQSFYPRNSPFVAISSNYLRPKLV